MKEYFIDFFKQFCLTVAIIACLGLVGYLTNEVTYCRSKIDEQKKVIAELKEEIETALDYKYRLVKCKRRHLETLRQLGLDNTNSFGIDK